MLFNASLSEALWRPRLNGMGSFRNEGHAYGTARIKNSVLCKDGTTSMRRTECAATHMGIRNLRAATAVKVKVSRAQRRTRILREKGEVFDRERLTALAVERAQLGVWSIEGPFSVIQKGRVRDWRQEKRTHLLRGRF